MIKNSDAVKMIMNNIKRILYCLIFISFFCILTYPVKSENLTSEQIIKKIQQKIDLTQSFHIHTIFKDFSEDPKEIIEDFYFNVPNKYRIDRIVIKNGQKIKYTNIYNGVYLFDIIDKRDIGITYETDIMKYPIKEINLKNTGIIRFNYLGARIFPYGSFTSKDYKFIYSGKKNDKILLIGKNKKYSNPRENYFFIDPKTYFIEKELSVEKEKNGKDKILSEVNVEYTDFGKNNDENLFKINPTWFEIIKANFKYLKVKYSKDIIIF